MKDNKQNNKRGSEKRSIDWMSVLGLLLACGLMFIGVVLIKEVNKDTNSYQYVMSYINLANFYDLTSVFIVIGGTFAALMIAFPAKQFLKMGKHLKIVFFPKKFEPSIYIDQIVKCAQKARVNGLLALEEDLETLDDDFMRNGMMMVVDSVDPEKVKQQLQARLDYMEERHSQERSFYDKGAVFAPAFGMIGTLIGLINMMKNLSDTESVGPNMAVALITTFYGSVLSNVIFMPISNKLRVQHEQEYVCKMIVCEGIQAIQEGENPKFIQNRLIQLLPAYMQEKVLKELSNTKEEVKKKK